MKSTIELKFGAKRAPFSVEYRAESPIPETAQATSEERFGIVAQPEPTCPMVDSVLDALKDAESRIKGWDRMEFEELKGAVDYAEWYIDRAKDELENVRQSNMDLRNWGEEWKREAKYLESNAQLRNPHQ